MATNDFDDLNKLFQEVYTRPYYKDITVPDTKIARKLHPNAEKLEDGSLKIGEKFNLPDSRLYELGRRFGKSFGGQAVYLTGESEDTDGGEEC
jgi:hypothetical protein